MRKIVADASPHPCPPPFFWQPLPEGQSRQWEDWEYSYTPLMISAFVIYGAAYYYRPKGSAQEAAHREALARMEAAEEED